MKYNIAFFCQSIPFTDKTCRLEHSLGGSETMLIGMARELVKKGHFVQVFTTFADISHEGEYNGVHFYDHSHFKALLPSVDWDIFISLRMPDIMTAPVRAKARFLWNQDELTNPKGFMSCLWQTDRLFWISEWQKQHYCAKLPELEPSSYVTRNGIDIDFINESIRGVQKDPYKLIYISRPERGLEPLLQIFPKVRKHCPEVKLYCARYYSMYEPMPNIKAICDRADRQMAMTAGCEYLGNLSKAELYKEIASSRLMVYPGVPNFNETGCIAAMEAQQCGTPIICTNRGALQETVASGESGGVKIDGDAYSDVYQAIFVQNVLNLLVDDERYEEMVKAGRVHMEKYDYSVIASEWSDFFDDFFEERFQKHGKRIFENLMRYDDVVAAWHLAKTQGLEVELHHAEARLYIDEEHDKEEYAKFAIAPTIDESTGRFAQIIAAVTEINPDADAPLSLIDQASLPAVETISQQYMQGKALRILDFACGNGALAVHLAKGFPNARIAGYDFSPELVRIANQFAKDNQVDNRVRIVEGSFSDIKGIFDVIVCGEFLEHCPDYKEVIETLESHLAPDGVMVFTMPYGPFAELLERGKPKATHRGHVLHWEWGDIQAVFGKKKRYNPRALQTGQTKRGNQVGSWIVVYRKSTDAETGEIDFQKKIRITRPFEKLSFCMIARNVAKWIDLCLENVVDIADEIIVATNEPDEDGTVEKLEKWGAQIITLPTLCPGVPSDTPPPGNFSWIRNESIKPATGDWIFWIDTDEILTYPNCIRKYLTDNPYNGFGLRQQHFSVDQQLHHDGPIRIFRNGKGYQFYGCIHEHAEDGMDTPIKPALEIPECDLAHFGYVTEQQRRFKCIKRNFVMLELDSTFFPGRQLTSVLYARDHLNFALWERQRYNDRNTPEAERQLWMAVKRYQKGPWYNNPKHLYFKHIFVFYQSALQWLNVGLSFGLQDERGGQLRFLSLDEFVEYSKNMIDIKKEELEYDFPHLPIARG
jgi:2-polyprenyl-3-methyl-5-hydroxy-6-metoxy-1,4-benzoquinol methylase/glycosyltransferase involved in cell wall biosynthesis